MCNHVYPRYSSSSTTSSVCYVRREMSHEHRGTGLTGTGLAHHVRKYRLEPGRRVFQHRRQHVTVGRVLACEFPFGFRPLMTDVAQPTKRLPTEYDPCRRCGECRSLE